MESNSYSNSARILVVGATGSLGMEICRQLIAANKKVKGLVRNSSDLSKVSELESMGVQTVIGDLKDKSSLLDACLDTDTVISTATAIASKNEEDTLETVDRDGQNSLVEAASMREVRKFIYISIARMNTGAPIEEAKRAVEKKILDSGMDYTILQPTQFMDVWLSPALGFDYNNNRAVVYGNGENKLSWISMTDVASYAVGSVDSEEASNAIIPLGGPEDLSPHEVISIFENRTGRFFEVQHVPEEILEAQKEEAGDTRSKTFACLMISFAKGNSVRTDTELSGFPVKLKTVRDYATSVTDPKFNLFVDEDGEHVFY